MLTQESIELSARSLKILECEAWFEVAEKIAKQHGLWIEHESRIEKSIRVRHPKSGKQLGRLWISYSGIISYELASRPTRSTFVAGTISDALAAIADSVQF